MNEDDVFAAFAAEGYSKSDHEGSGPRHVVHFYAEGMFPCASIAEFIWIGIQAGDSAALLTSPEQIALVREKLLGHGASLDELERSGRLRACDSRSTMAAFMADGVLDRARFASFAREIVDAGAAVSTSGAVRVYGDCVAVIAGQGHIEASLIAERVWNSLLSKHAVALYCAYPLQHFGHPSHAEGFRALCDEHDHVIPVLTSLAAARGHTRCIAVLQQQALALEAEVADRRRSEVRLESLVRLSAVLASSRDYEATLASVLALAIPSLGDLGFLEVIEGEGRARRLALVPGDARQEARLQASSGEDVAAQLPELQLASPITAPLEYEGRVVGQLTLYRRSPARPPERGDVELLREMAHRVAAFVENARLHRERSEAMRRLTEADRRKDEFLAMLGHELRNPLAPITTAVDLMELRGDSQGRRERAVIRRQASHLKRLVDDLLDIARITRGKIELHRVPLEIATVVHRAIELASPALAQRSHALSVRVPREGLAVYGDPTRLCQIFANLLGNAAMYTDPGGRIAVSARREGEALVVDVADNGCGIRPEMLASIFDLFVQGERPIARTQGGLGLGLALVKIFAELHGGAVLVESAGPAQGSTFTVRLPALSSADAVALVEASPAPAPSSPRRGRRVLIVDDNQDATDLLAEMLADAGFETAVAYDGAEALQRVEESPPDVMLIDIGLPVMNGYELAARLREALPASKLRLIAVTGYGQDTDREQSRKAGFDLHLVKPVDLDTLQRAIEAPFG